MIYPNQPLYLLSLLGYIYYLTYYTLTTKDNITSTFLPFGTFLMALVLVRFHIRNPFPLLTLAVHDFLKVS